MGQNVLRRVLILALAAALTGGAGPASAGDSEHYLVGLGLYRETGRNIYPGGIYLDQNRPRSRNLALLSGPWLMEYRIVARRTSIRSLLGGVLLLSEVATGEPPDEAATDFANAILSGVKTSLYAGDTLAISLDQSGDTSASLNDRDK